MPLRPGQSGDIYTRRSDRPFVCLAVIGDQSLIEYTLPRGCSSLRIVGPGARRVRYEDIPTKWLRAIIGAGTDWTGKPSRTHGRIILKPHEMLANRCGPRQMCLPIYEPRQLHLLEKEQQKP